MKRTLSLCGLLAMLWPAFASAQFSADYQTNVISGVVSNWTGNYVVGSNTVFDLLRIENGGVLSNANGYIGYETAASNNSVVVSGSGSVWSNSGVLYVGYSSAGNSLIISNGGTALAQNVTLGNLAGSKGTLTVAGGTLTALNAGTLIVGSEGVGDLVISNGAVNLSSLRVAGNVGSAGTLHVCGGSLNVANELIFGQEAGPTASVWVTGGRMTFSGYSVHVGGGCDAELTISNGTFAASFLFIGNGNVGTVTVAGGHFTNEFIDIALTTNATLWVTGGLVEPKSGVKISYGPGGQMIVSNGQVKTPFIGIGEFGSGTLTVAGGTIEVANECDFGMRNGATGEVWVTGGSLIATNILAVGGSSYYSSFSAGGYGRLSASNGTVTAGSLMVGSFNNANGSVNLAGATVTVDDGLLIGTPNCSGSGVVTVTSGSLLVTNASHDAVLEVRSGTLTQTGGALLIDTLVITNACGHFIHTVGSLFTGTLLLGSALDADGDGLPNGWEQSHGLDPLTPNAGDDPDGDGLSNAQEFVLGTDPSDSSSPYRITAIAREGANIRLTWATVGGKTNFVQVTSDLASNFTDISSTIVIVGGGLTSTNYLDSGVMTNLPSFYYRIRLVP